MGTRRNKLLRVPDAFLIARRVEITSLAARYRLPAIYPARHYVDLGAGRDPLLPVLTLGGRRRAMSDMKRRTFITLLGGAAAVIAHAPALVPCRPTDRYAMRACPRQ